MSRRKRWEESEVVAGYGEIKLLSWRYFLDFVQQEMLDHRHYIWRGQRNDDWLLESTLDRLIKKSKTASKNRSIFRENHLKEFQLASRGRRGINPPIIENENDWWALGQHYGIATPLLDWTKSPFVAAYFSFIGNGKPQTRHRAVYALHKPTIDSRAAEIVDQKYMERLEEKELLRQGKIEVGGLDAAAARVSPISRDVEFIRPMSDENQRLVNQGG